MVVVVVQVRHPLLQQRSLCSVLVRFSCESRAFTLLPHQTSHHPHRHRLHLTRMMRLTHSVMSSHRRLTPHLHHHLRLFHALFSPTLLKVPASWRRRHWARSTPCWVGMAFTYTRCQTLRRALPRGSPWPNSPRQPRPRCVRPFLSSLDVE